MAQLDLQTPAQVAAHAPFPAHVSVSGGAAGATVDVSLQQTRGIAPLFSAGPLATTLDASGNGSVIFSAVSLAGPTRAVLIATASDTAHGFYQPDAETVQVL
jgi:hypothetical protein